MLNHRSAHLINMRGLSKKPKNAVEAWKEANDEARIAESILARAWADFEAGRAGPVHPDLIREVAQARSKANDKLTVALRELGKRDWRFA